MNKQAKFFLSILLFSFIFVQAQNDKNNSLFPVGLTIIVNDLQISSNWYKENLNFQVHKKLPQKYVLQRGDFYLELKSVDGSLNEKDIKLPEDYKFINGYSKFSFVVDNLKGLYNHLFINGVNVFRPITEGEFFQGKYFVITDPDGNYLQFFSNSDSDIKVNQIKMKPFLMSKMVSNIEESIEWYKNVLNCNVSETLDIPDHNLKLGYLELNGFYFELIQTGVSLNKSSLDKFKDKHIQGFCNLTLYAEDINNTVSAIKATDYVINNTIEPADFNGFKKQFNFKDLSENNIQIIN